MQKPVRSLFILRRVDQHATVLGVYTTLGALIYNGFVYNTLNAVHVRYIVRPGWLETSPPQAKWWTLVIEDHMYAHNPRRFYYIITKERGMLMTSYVNEIGHRKWIYPAPTR
jgi:hypothetical protein